MDDSDLIRAFQAGDPGAFDALVERHREVAYRVARRVLRNHEDADDATQEAFVKAFRALPGFKGESSFRTWIYRITMNAALDMRSRHAARTRLHEAAGQEACPAPLHAAPGGLAGLVRTEQLGALRAAIERLPDRQRLTLGLRVSEGLKYSEIADVLECPVGTVKANFHHAVKNLRRLLAAPEAAPEVAPEIATESAEAAP